jgi:hypothetical protein
VLINQGIDSLHENCPPGAHPELKNFRILLSLLSLHKLST